MPNLADKNVFASGIRTCPPSASAAKTRSASASVATFSASEKPLNFPSSGEQPSDAIRVLPPTRKLACITFFSQPGASMPGGGDSGLSLWRMSMSTSAPMADR